MIETGNVSEVASMNTPDARAIIQILSQRSEISAYAERDGEGTDNSGHPFGSVLWRLELAIALIYASRRQDSLPRRLRAQEAESPHRHFEAS